jgi:SAM-dependent methyltransferase
MDSAQLRSDSLCPLCNTADAQCFYRDRHRGYFQCPGCELVFVPPAQFLSLQQEKAHYDLHENSPDDPDYRRFLSRVYAPMQQRIRPGSCGLDFGSGPGPTLSRMFTEAGHVMSIYDPFYASDPSALKTQYDFITATEVVEHLHNPVRDLNKLWSCLKPGGTLGIMTKLVLNQEAFMRWHYKNDPTHVCFFSHTSFVWLGAQWQAELLFAAPDVILLGKGS